MENKACPILYSSGNGDLWPSIGALLALYVPEAEARKNRIICLNAEEIEKMADVTRSAITYVHERREAAMQILQSPRPDICLHELLELAGGKVSSP